MTTSPAKPLRAFYTASIADFVHADPSFVLGCLSDNSGFSIETTQRDAWRSQISILQNELLTFAGKGSVLFEFSVPRLGKRIDVLALIDHVIFVIEFKVGESLFNRSAVDQVWDYALDLKNFHETSHHCMIAPLLVATRATRLVEPTRRAMSLCSPSKSTDSIVAESVAAVPGGAFGPSG